MRHKELSIVGKKISRSYLTFRCFYVTCRNVPYVRYGSKRTDQRYVTVSYVTLRYVRVENTHNSVDYYEGWQPLLTVLCSSADELGKLSQQNATFKHCLECCSCFY